MVYDIKVHSSYVKREDKRLETPQYNVVQYNTFNYDLSNKQLNLYISENVKKN